MQTLDDAALDTLFREARTHSIWRPEPVTDETLRALYDLLKWAPTSANAAPARFVFSPVPAAKERLATSAGAAQRREDDARPRDGDRGVRPEILRAPAEAVPAESGDGEDVF